MMARAPSTDTSRGEPLAKTRPMKSAPALAAWMAPSTSLNPHALTSTESSSPRNWRIKRAASADRIKASPTSTISTPSTW